MRSIVCHTWRAVAFFALLVSMAAYSHAQNATGAINGTVTDPTNAVIANAIVAATNMGTGATRSITTGANGTFRFENLQPGQYQIRAEAIGFAAQTQPVVVQVASTTSVNFSMTVGQVTETVEVTGASQSVNTTESTVSTTFNQQQVDTLPLNGRSFLSVAMLDPGTNVQYSAGTSTALPLFNASTRVAIASPFSGEVSNVQTNVQVDGIRVNDRYTGNVSQNFSAEIVQEFQLNTLTFDLSAGTSASGVVNTVTRSGTSEYHGSGFLYFRDHNMAAYPALKRSAFNPDPYFARKQYGFTVTGPINKDKLLFLANYERNNQVGARTIQFTDPLVAAFNHIGRLPTNANLAGLRLDYKASTRHNAFFRFNVDQNRALVGGATMESTWLATDNFSYQSVMGVTSVFKPTLVNDFRFGYSYYRDAMAVVTPEECLASAGNADFCVGLGGPRINFNVGGFQIGTDFSVPQDRHQRSNQFTDNVNWTKGTHNIRFGGNWEHTWSHGSINIYRSGMFATYTPVQLQGLNLSLYNTLPASLRSVPGTKVTIQDLLQLPVTGALTMGSGDPTWPNSYGRDDLLGNDLVRFYVQDSWQARPRFTLNYGLAWSMETNVPYHKLDLPAYLAPLGMNLNKIPLEYKHFEPALGFAWSPMGSNKTVIRASASIHYASQNRTVDKMNDQGLRSPAGSGLQTLTSASLANPRAGQPGQPATLNFSAPTSFIGQDMMNYLPAAAAQFAQIVGKYNGTDPSIRNIEVLKQNTAGSTNFIFDGNTKTPYTIQVNAGVQRELVRNLSLSVDYVMIRAVRFGAQDVYNVDLNRWNRFSNYTIDPNTGAANPNAFRNPVLPVCTPAQSLDPKAQCSSGSIAYAFSGRGGRYNSLQLRLDRRFDKGFQLTGTYALTKRTANQTPIGRFDNYNDTYGITPDSKHKMTANATWSVPNYKGDHRFLRGLAGGWQLSTIMQMQTGAPINVTLGSFDPVGDGSSYFRLPGLNVNEFGWSKNADDIRNLVDKYNATYPAPANVALKDIPRSQRDAQGRPYPYIVLPPDFRKNDSFLTHDLRLSRTIRIGETAKIQFTAEGFNIFNIANLTAYTATLDAYVRPGVTGGNPTLPAQVCCLASPPTASTRFSERAARAHSSSRRAFPSSTRNQNTKERCGPFVRSVPFPETHCMWNFVGFAILKVAQCDLELRVDPAIQSISLAR